MKIQPKSRTIIRSFCFSITLIKDNVWKNSTWICTCFFGTAGKFGPLFRGRRGLTFGMRLPTGGRLLVERLRASGGLAFFVQGRLDVQPIDLSLWSVSSGAFQAIIIDGVGWIKSASSASCVSGPVGIASLGNMAEPSVMIRKMFLTIASHKKINYNHSCKLEDMAL